MCGASIFLPTPKHGGLNKWILTPFSSWKCVTQFEVLAQTLTLIPVLWDSRLTSVIYYYLSDLGRSRLAL